MDSRRSGSVSASAVTPVRAFPEDVERHPASAPRAEEQALDEEDEIPAKPEADEDIRISDQTMEEGILETVTRKHEKSSTTKAPKISRDTTKRRDDQNDDHKVDSSPGGLSAWIPTTTGGKLYGLAIGLLLLIIIEMGLLMALG